jgi:peptide/nickel transport system ATP-binding protein
MLLSAIPIPDPSARVARDEYPTPAGEVPSPLAPPSGCRFRTRCPAAQQRCVVEEPQIRKVGEDHFIACHFPISGPEAAPTVSTATAHETPVTIGMGD